MNTRHPHLDSTRAARMAVNVGGFPVRQVEKIELGSVDLSPAQDIAICKVAPLIADGGTILLRGGVGCGKTHLACCLGYLWYKRRYSTQRGKALYWTMTGLLADQKGTFGRRENQDAPLKLAAECGLLVIDEILTTNESVFDQNTARDLIDKRYRNKRPTVLLTNLDDTSLREALDNASIDRIFDGGAVITIPTASMRGQTTTEGTK